MTLSQWKSPLDYVYAIKRDPCRNLILRLLSTRTWNRQSFRYHCQYLSHRHLWIFIRYSSHRLWDRRFLYRRRNLRHYYTRYLSSSAAGFIWNLVHNSMGYTLSCLLRPSSGYKLKVLTVLSCPVVCNRTWIQLLAVCDLIGARPSVPLW